MPRHGPRAAFPRVGLVAPLGGVFIRRSIVYWALLHALLAAVALAAALLAGHAIEATELLPGGSPVVVFFTVVLGMMEARRRDEDLFLANLGYGRGVMAAYLALPALALEVLFSLLGGG